MDSPTERSTRTRADLSSSAGKALRGAMIAFLTWALAMARGSAGGTPTTVSPRITPQASLSGAGAPPIRFVALGDSYTIGTAVTSPERWPDQLVAALDAAAGSAPPAALELVANLGVNGFTSGDVVVDELPRLQDLRPGFISLLVGVNDVVRGVPPGVYRANVRTILDAIAATVGPGRVLVVTTPDYTVTPAGHRFGDPASQSAGIRAFNAIETAEATSRGIAVVDIYDISLGASSDRSLVAGDGLHPSGTQYGLWVERILPVVRPLLANE